MSAPTTEPLWVSDCNEPCTNWREFNEETREELREWARSQGIDPMNTFRVEVYVIDAAFAVATHFVRDDDGRIMLTDDREEARTYTATYPLSSLPLGMSA